MKRKGNFSNISNSPSKKQKGEHNTVSYSAFLTPKGPNFSDFTNQVVECAKVSDIWSGPDLHNEIIKLCDDLCPKNLKLKHPIAMEIMKHYILKKEVVLAINNGKLELFGEKIFFHDFDNGGEENQKQVCFQAVGLQKSENDSFPAKIFERKPSSSYYLRNVSGTVDKSISRSVKNGHCLVSSISPETTIFINDDESGLHRDYNNWQTKFTKGYKFKNQLKRVMMGREILVSVKGGNLDFGTWEQIFDGSFSTTSNGKGGYMVKSVGGSGLKHSRLVLERYCKNRFHPVDITETAKSFVTNSGIQNGILLFNSMHITSGCFVGVDDEKLLKDLFSFLEFVAPEKPWNLYNHNGYETNGDAHHKRQILSRSVAIPVIKGEMILGDNSYSLFYGECDGQRSKRQLLTIVGI